MIKHLFLALFSALLFQFGYSQTDQKCSKSCCESHKDESIENQAISSDTIVLSCKLTTLDMQKRKETVIADLKSKYLEKLELENGYSFKFEGSDENIDLLTAFIKSERACCDFFNFSLQVKNDNTVWLDITGSKEAKSFIVLELGL